MFRLSRTQILQIKTLHSTVGLNIFLHFTFYKLFITYTFNITVKKIHVVFRIQAAHFISFLCSFGTTYVATVISCSHKLHLCFLMWIMCSICEFSHDLLCMKLFLFVCFLTSTLKLFSAQMLTPRDGKLCLLNPWAKAQHFWSCTDNNLPLRVILYYCIQRKYSLTKYIVNRSWD